MSVFERKCFENIVVNKVLFIDIVVYVKKVVFELRLKLKFIILVFR